MNSESGPHPANQFDASRRVWDLPVRLFHWSLVICVCGSWFSAEQGLSGTTMHRWFGYTTLTLVLFRLIWGLIGSPWARFGSFLFPPWDILRYVRSLPAKTPLRYTGHNPLGGLMVLFLLFLLLVQAISGLFANDDLFLEGPLYPLVSNALSDGLTTLHKLNFNLLGAAILVHVAAVLYYLTRKRENLITPMFTGRKHTEDPESMPDLPFASLWKALLVLALCAITVALLVTQLPRLA